MTLAGNPYTNLALVILIEIPSVAFLAASVERFGRKLTYILSCIFASIATLMLILPKFMPMNPWAGVFIMVIAKFSNTIAAGTSRIWVNTSDSITHFFCFVYV